MEGLVQDVPDDLKPLLSELKEMMTDFQKLSRLNEGREWKGYRFPQIFNSDTAKKVYEDFEFEEESVILSTFPKTGTNWIGEVIRQILFGHDDRLIKIAKAVPLPLFVLEVWKPEKIDLLKHVALPRKVYLTHLPEELINFEKVKKSKSKVIVMVRNPKDTAVSWYHFSQGPQFEPYREHLSPDWNKFYSDYIQGKQPVPVTKPGEGYAEFLLGWYKRRNESNILFVHFEKMKKNAGEEIRRMAKFLEVDLTEEQISAIVEKTSFSSMKKAQESGDNLEKIRKMLNLVRKGQVGSWKETFTVAQSEAMDKLIEDKLGGTDIKFIYE